MSSFKKVILHSHLPLFLYSFSSPTYNENRTFCINYCKYGNKTQSWPSHILQCDNSIIPDLCPSYLDLAVECSGKLCCTPYTYSLYPYCYYHGSIESFGWCINYYLGNNRTYDNPYNTQVRLTNGDYPSMGYVLIYLNEQWGPVCNEIDNGAADSVCKQMGYTNAASHALQSSNLSDLN